MSTGSTLVVVADGSVARFLRRARPGARLVELIDKRMNIGAVEPARDRPARTHDGVDWGGCGIEHRPTPRAAAEAAFLRYVLDEVAMIVNSEKAARVVFCAPPTALGILRSGLTADLRERLILSLGKDVVKETPADINQRLRDLHV